MVKAETYESEFWAPEGLCPWGHRRRSTGQGVPSQQGTWLTCTWSKAGLPQAAGLSSLGCWLASGTNTSHHGWGVGCPPSWQKPVHTLCGFGVCSVWADACLLTGFSQTMGAHGAWVVFKILCTRDTLGEGVLSNPTAPTLAEDSHTQPRASPAPLGSC